MFHLKISSKSAPSKPETQRFMIYENVSQTLISRKSTFGDKTSKFSFELYNALVSADIPLY